MRSRSLSMLAYDIEIRTCKLSRETLKQSPFTAQSALSHKEHVFDFCPIGSAEGSLAISMLSDKGLLDLCHDAPRLKLTKLLRRLCHNCLSPTSLRGWHQERRQIIVRKVHEKNRFRLSRGKVVLQHNSRETI